MKLPNLQAALVIAGDSGLRKCIMNQLRHEGWIVHGIPKAEHALPILAHIPYQLIIVDCVNCLELMGEISCICCTTLANGEVST